MFVFEGIGDLFGGHMILFILFQAEQDHLAFFCYLIHGFISFICRGCGELMRGLENLGKLFERKVYKGGFAAERCRRERQKDLIGLARSRYCGELNRGLQNLEVP